MKGVVLVVKSPDVNCLSIDTCDSVHSHVTKKEHKINFAFNCDLCNVVYDLLSVSVCITHAVSVFNFALRYGLLLCLFTITLFLMQLNLFILLSLFLLFWPWRDGRYQLLQFLFVVNYPAFPCFYIVCY